MRKLLLIALFLPAVSQANPILTADPVPAASKPIVSSCGVYLDGARTVIPISVKANGDKVCEADLSGISVGNHTGQLSFIGATDPDWGDIESPASPPFSFVRPAVPPAPTGIRIRPAPTP